MSGTKYFKFFPKEPYKFGDNELPINYQNLSVYIDTFDQIREFETLYQNYTIQNNQRPDQLSFELYGGTDYYWTFWIMNTKLRESGWPLDNSVIYDQAQKYYPNKTVTTDGISFQPATGILRPFSTSENFAVGKYVYLSLEKKAVKILRIEENLAQVYLDWQGNFSESVLLAISDEDAIAVNTVDEDYIPTILDESSIQETFEGWDAIHHYEDTDGNWVYPSYNSTEPYSFDWSSVNSFQSVSYFQRLRDKNDDLRPIRILKPEVLTQVLSEFNQLLKQRK